MLLRSYLGTIRCDFDQDWCNFQQRSDGDDASKKGFEWMRHNGKWLQEQNADGPYQGMNFNIWYVFLHILSNIVFNIVLTTLII